MAKTILLPSVMLVFILSSCYYHKEDVLYGGSCDTTHVTYSTTIKSLLSNYGCLGCHIGGNPPGGINLETYTNVKILVNNGRFYGAITHAPGFRPMPDGAAKMNDCDISKIKVWIDSGAPNN
jgi:hypothetical protein